MCSNPIRRRVSEEDETPCELCVPPLVSDIICVLYRAKVWFTRLLPESFDPSVASRINLLPPNHRFSPLL
jgi:hypothetical protein